MERVLYFFTISLLIFVFLVTGAGAEELNRYNNLIINITFNSSVISAEKTDLEIDASIFPLEDERQQIIDSVIQGQGTINKQDGSVKYEWHSVRNVVFGWNAIVKTSFYMPEVSHITFPSKIVGFDEYKKATEYIDINDEIIQKANELVAGKTDWFEAVNEIAVYVYDTMAYDKEFINSQQKASWVMKNKRGVCDEYTVLFLALVRALGIPARYISGIAYSNIENDFGNHAWAEVYNGNEWIPFDTTFGQFGWIDASHVALSKTFDTKTANVKYLYTSSEITTSALNIKADAVGKINELSGTDFLEFNIMPLKTQIGSDSFLPLKISVKNTKDYYLPLLVYIYKGVNVVGKNSIHMLIPPLTTKTSFFILKLPKAEQNYIYTATIEARTQFNDFALAALDFSNDYEVMDLQTAKSLVVSLEESEIDYRYDASIDCMPLDNYYYGEEIKINCTVLSDSNAMLSDLSMCAREKCYKFDLPINGMINREFSFISNDSSYIVRLSNKNITKTQFVPVNIMEKPDLQILDLTPLTIDYYGTNISLIAKTNSVCKEGLLNMNGMGFELGDLDKISNYSINFAGKNALHNKLNVKMTCKDLRGSIYENNKVFEIQIENIPWYSKIWQRIILLF